MSAFAITNQVLAFAINTVLAALSTSPKGAKKLFFSSLLSEIIGWDYNLIR